MAAKAVSIVEKEKTPTSDAAATQHGALPVRSGTAAGKPIPRGPFPLDIPVLQALKGKRIILASASPRRKQLLATVSFPLNFLIQDEH